MNQNFAVHFNLAMKDLQSKGKYQLWGQTSEGAVPFEYFVLTNTGQRFW